MTELEVQVEDLRGEFVDAIVTSINDEHVTVSLRSEAQGMIPRADLVRIGSAELGVNVGDSFSVYVEQPMGEHYLVSKDKADRMAQFDRLGALKRAGELVEGEVVGIADGGFVIDVGVRAFCPGSQFALRPVRNPDQLLGQTFTFKIARFEKNRQNVVLSRRALLEKERDTAVGRIKVGALVQGKVVRFTDFGAFVDIGGVDGLLHIGDMSWGRINKPSEIVELGEELTLKVLKFDKKNQRISLGLRQCNDDPWLTVAETYPAGTRVNGPIVSKTDFGCFIDIGRGIEGLVHVTGPMVTDTAQKVLNKADIGDELEATVLDLDISQKRMSLALHEEA